MAGVCVRIVLLFFVVIASAKAEPVEVVDVAFKEIGKAWEVRVMLHHEDEGWDHYADGWRISSEAGEILASGALREPNRGQASYMVNLRDVMIPPGAQVLFVEAHENRLGWSTFRVRVDLAKSEGPRYRVFQRH